MYDDFSNINGGQNPHFTVVDVKNAGDLAVGGESTKDAIAAAEKEIKGKKDAEDAKKSKIPGPAAETPEEVTGKASGKTDSKKAFEAAIPSDKDAAAELGANVDEVANAEKLDDMKAKSA